MNFGLLRLPVEADSDALLHRVNSLNNATYSKKLCVQAHGRRSLLEAVKQRVASLVHIHVVSGVSSPHDHAQRYKLSVLVIYLVVSVLL